MNFSTKYSSLQQKQQSSIPKNETPNEQSLAKKAVLYLSPLFISFLVVSLVSTFFHYRAIQQKCFDLVEKITPELLVKITDCNWYWNTHWNNSTAFFVPNWDSLVQKESDFNGRVAIYNEAKAKNEELKQIVLVFNKKEIPEIKKTEKLNSFLETAQELNNQNNELELEITHFAENIKKEFNEFQLQLEGAKALNVNTQKAQEIYLKGQTVASLPINNEGDAKSAVENLASLKKAEEDLKKLITQKKEELLKKSWQYDIIFSEGLSNVVLSDELAIQSTLTPDCKVVKCIALTFDDGPSPETTTKLLNILSKRNVKATFFVTGNNVNNHPDIVTRTYKEGNEIGNHSWSHADFTTLSDTNIAKEVDRTNKAIEKATGVAPKLFRPPYGAINQRVKADINMPLILWDVDTLDWKNRDATIVAKRVVKSADKNKIILMHDIHATSVEAVAPVLDTLIEEGYYFVTVSQLAGNNLQNNAVYSGG